MVGSWTTVLRGRSMTAAVGEGVRWGRSRFPPPTAAMPRHPICRPPPNRPPPTILPAASPKSVTCQQPCKGVQDSHVAPGPSANRSCPVRGTWYTIVLAFDRSLKSICVFAQAYREQHPQGLSDASDQLRRGDERLAVEPLDRAVAEDRRARAGTARAGGRPAPQAQPFAAISGEERRTALAAAGRGLRPGARSRPADDQHAALRRADPRRHRHVPSLDRRDADGRRKNAHRHAATLLARPDGPRRAPGDRQRLSRPPRRRLDGPGLPRARAERRRGRNADGPAGAAEGLRLRHHLRHGQGVRFRFSPRPPATATDRRGANRLARRDAGPRPRGDRRKAGAARRLFRPGR